MRNLVEGELPNLQVGLDFLVLRKSTCTPAPQKGGKNLNRGTGSAMGASKAR